MLHALGEILPGQHFGVNESFMQKSAGQVICSIAKAAEDSVLIYFDCMNFLSSFTSDQIIDILDVAK